MIIVSPLLSQLSYSSWRTLRKGAICRAKKLLSWFHYVIDTLKFGLFVPKSKNSLHHRSSTQGNIKFTMARFIFPFLH
jgi:hypothetical protein